MKTILNALTHDTFTILGTLILIGFLAWLFKKQILLYLQKKYNLFSEDDMVSFANQHQNKKLSPFTLKQKLFTYKLKRDVRK